MAVDIENIGGCSSEEPVGSFRPVLYWAERKDFETVLDPKDICDEDGNGAASFEELQEITGNHVMKAGKKLHTVDFETETGEMTSTLIGDAKVIQNESKITVYGSSSKILGFFRFIRRKDLVFFLEEAGTGRFRQLGSDRIPARVTAEEVSIAALVEGANSLVLTVTDKQKWFAPIYLGDLDIATDSE